jgi:lipopolysaccharide export system permease protein
LFRTLSLFLSRELLKVTSLALGAFTLVMTVFAIIEPLRRRGLGAEQVLALFGYTLPGMVSLTLPIAALFAATIVYGRFSQDNELMACRAGGIPTLSLLKPALVLGAVVTIASLLLSNLVTPRMAALAAKSVTRNVPGIVRERLVSQGYINYQSYIIHAARARDSQDLLELEGVVAADLRKEEDLRFLSAQTAVVSFTPRYGQTYATVHLIQPTVTRTGAQDILQETTGPLPPEPAPSLVKDNPAWYDWSQLRRTLANPLENRQVGDELRKIQRGIRHSMLCREIADVINAGRPYDRLANGREQVVIEAAQAQLAAGDEETSLLSSPERPVRVSVLRNGQVYQTATADHGAVEPLWSAEQDLSLVRLRLAGNVESGYWVGGQLQESHRRDEMSFSPLPIPRDILQHAQQIRLEDIYRAADHPGFSPRVRASINNLKQNVIATLTNKIIAEMHVRVSYGLSCFLMVALGAALGLMFRGGQMISAFTLSVIPASVVIVLIMMGKQMVRNSRVSTTAGLAAMWSGIVILSLANAAVYARLARK